MRLLVLSPRFWPLFAATSLGAFADNALRQATVIAVFAAATATGPQPDFALPAGLGNYAGAIVSMGFTLPIFLFSGLAGQAADAFDRRRLVRWLKAIEVALMFFAALAFALGNAVVLLFSLVLMGTQSAFFSPVRFALMPHYYAENELPRANGYYNAALFVAIVAGLGLGGAFIGMPGGRVTVSAILVASAGLGALATLALPPAPVVGLPRLDLNLVRVAIRFFRRSAEIPGVIAPMIGTGWFWMVNAALLAVLPNLIRDDFAGGEDGIIAAFVIAGLGAGIGSMVAGLATHHSGRGFALSGIGVVGVAGACLFVWQLAMAFTPPPEGFVSMANAPLFLGIFAIAFFNGLFVVPLLAAVQSRAPERIRATVMGAANMTNGGLATLGAAAIWIALSLGAASADTLLGVAMVQVGLLGAMVIRRRQARSPQR